MWQTSAVLAQSALQTTRGLESGQSAVQGIASVLPPHDNAPAQTGLWGGHAQVYLSQPRLRK